MYAGRTVAKAAAVLLALMLLLTGCTSVDFRDGYWAEREDVLFATAMETGFYYYIEKDQFACTIDFTDDWSGPGEPDKDTLAKKDYAFSAAGYLDMLQPHEGTKPEDIYETAFIFSLIYNKDTRQVTAAGGYMDEGIDDISGAIDADTATMFIDLFYSSYDSYVTKYGDIA